MRLLGALLALATLATPSPSEGQQPVADEPILRQAISAIRGTLPSGPMAVVAEAPWEGASAADREALLSVGETLDVPVVANVEEVLACDSLPSSCRLTAGLTSFVAPGKPSVSADGSRASVEFVLRWFRPNSQRQPVPSRTVRVDLASGPEGWTVDSITVLSAS